jgi:hypothetical protein
LWTEVTFFVVPILFNSHKKIADLHSIQTGKSILKMPRLVAIRMAKGVFSFDLGGFAD